MDVFYCDTVQEVLEGSNFAYWFFPKLSKSTGDKEKMKKNSKVRKFENSKIRKFENSKIQKFKNSKIQKFVSSEIQKFENSGAW